MPHTDIDECQQEKCDVLECVCVCAQKSNASEVSEYLSWSLDEQRGAAALLHWLKNLMKIAEASRELHSTIEHWGKKQQLQTLVKEN